MVSRAMTRPPIAAWTAILNSCRGISSLSLAQIERPRASGGGAVGDEGEGIDRVLVDQDGDAHEVGGFVGVHRVVETRIAAADGFQAVVEIEHHLVERNAVDGHCAAADIGEIDLLAAAIVAQAQDGAEVVVGHHDGGAYPGFLDVVDQRGVGHVGGVVQLGDGAAGAVDAIDDAGGGGDQIEIEFAREAFLDDLEMQKSQESHSGNQNPARRRFRGRSESSHR